MRRESRRGALQALYAFNAEIAGIRDRIRQPLPGEIRLQWWRDVHRCAGERGGRRQSGRRVRCLPPSASYGLPRSRVSELPRCADLRSLRRPDADADRSRRLLRRDGRGPDPACRDGARSQTLPRTMRNSRAGRVARRRSPACFACCRCIARAASAMSRRTFFPRSGTSPEEFLKGEGDGPPRAVAAMIALAREHLTAFEQERPACRTSCARHFCRWRRPSAAREDERPGESRPVGNVDLAAWRKHWLMFRRATRGWR